MTTTRLGNITEQFHHIFGLVSELYFKKDIIPYHLLFDAFLGLGVMLGFTEEEIETAYKIKNAENHLRQRNGY